MLDASHSLSVGKAVSIAHAYRALTMAFFLIGHILHVAVQVDGLAKAHPSPKVSDWFVFSSNVISISWRFFLSFVIFLAIWSDPSGIASLLSFVGFSPGENLTAVLTFPMSPWFAGLWGLGLDWLLGNIPKLKSVLPPVEFTHVETTTEKVTKETTHSVVETPQAPSVDDKP